MYTYIYIYIYIIVVCLYVFTASCLMLVLFYASSLLSRTCSLLFVLHGGRHEGLADGTFYHTAIFHIVLIVLTITIQQSLVDIELVGYNDSCTVRPFFILRIVRPRIVESTFRNHCAKKLDGAPRKPTSSVYKFV